MRAHGRTLYTHGGCRCDICRAANTAAARQARLDRATRSAPGHGVSYYTNWGCRCRICTAANSAKSLERKRKTRESR